MKPFQHLGDPKQTRSAVWVVCVVAVALWLLSPVFCAAHLEAFSATISSMAISANEHVLASDDPSYPVVVEYLYQSRPGTVGLLRVLGTLFPAAGDWTFRLLMIASLITVLGGGAVLARRWGGTHAWAGVAAIILTPGIVEAAFGFNDNIVSLAFVMLALCLIGRGALIATALAGVLMSVATLARLDGVLALPTAAAFIWLSSSRAGIFARHTVAFVSGYGVGLSTFAGLWHVNLLDAVRIAEYFKNSHEGGVRALGHHFWVSVFFFGLPMLALLPLGIWDSLKGSTWKSRIVLVGYPVAFGILSVPRAVQTRDYLLLLAPFIVIVGGRGVEVLVQLATAGGAAMRRFSVIVSIAIALTLVFPPPSVMLQDGPRAPIGRLWSPWLWFRWQRAVESNLASLGRVVNVADATARTVVISTSFDDDRFLHLRLLQRGYHLSVQHASAPNCEKGIEVYQRDSHEVFLLRTHNYYMLAPASSDYLQALLLDTALGCGELFRANRIFLTTVGAGADLSAGAQSRADPLFGFILDRPLYSRLPAYLEFGDRLTLTRMYPHKLPMIRVAELSAQDLGRLVANARGVLAVFHTDGTPENRLLSYEAFRAVFAKRYWGPPDIGQSSSP